MNTAIATAAADVCCPRFDPAPWDGVEHEWHQRLFVQDTVRSLFHIPLNYGAVMTRNLRLIEAAHAVSPGRLTLSVDLSAWRSELYIEVAKPVPDARMTALSGRFVSKVFEGPFQQIGSWIASMNEYLRRRGESPQRLLFFYTTCPKCAKRYGQNYVVIFAAL